MTIKIILLISALSFPLTSNADEATSDAEALSKTQGMMRNSHDRQDFIKHDENAKKANDNLNSITGGNKQLNDEIFSLSADVFSIITKEANGDPAKMQELLQNYAQHPEEFANKFSPEQKERLHRAAERVPAKNSPK